MRAWVEGWIWDVRIALRSLMRRPAPSALVVGTLAVGIGANAAIFGILDRTILSPFRFPGGDRVVFVVDRDVERGFSMAPAQAELDRWREGARTVELLETLQESSALLVQGNRAERVPLTRVSLGLPAMVGLRPVLGRSFSAEDAEPGAQPVAMIHEDTWRSRFGAAPSVIGSAVSLDEETVEVIGVWPRDVRIQVDADPVFFTVLPHGNELQRSSFGIVLARLARWATPEDAGAELRTLQAGVVEEGEDLYPAHVVPPYTFLGDDFVRGLWILYGGVGLLLMVAVANASNVLLNRAMDRESELGVRMALGGGGVRLLRQFVLEGGLLAGAGALAGLAVARAGTALVYPLSPEGLPSAARVGLDSRTGAYAAALWVAVTLVCAVVPAWHLRGSTVRKLVSLGSGRGAKAEGRLGRWLLAGQVAVAVVLLAGTALTVRSLVRLVSVEPGFAVRELVLATVRAPEGRFPDEAMRVEASERVLERLAALPGVSSAAVTGVIPFRYSIRFGEPTLEDDEPVPQDDGAVSRTGTTTPGFLETMGIPLLVGRDFTPEERDTGAAARVVLVSEAFATRRPGGPRDILGRSLRFPSDTAGWRIVGVVGDVQSASLRAPAADGVEVYYPSVGPDGGTLHRFVVRFERPQAIVPAIREAVSSVDTRLVVESVQTGDELLAAQTREHRFLAVLLAVLAGLSLTLALAGVFGAVSLSVTRRNREIGIRRALGAGGARMVAMVVREGLAPVVVGAVTGGVAAAVLSRMAADVLFEVSPRDPLSFAVALLVPMVAAAVAGIVPAHRAVRVEPARTLQQE